MKGFSIQEFSRMTGISAHTLRFFDKIALLTPRRASNGYREYTVPQVAEAQVIMMLQQAKLPNSDIASILTEHANKRTIELLKYHERILRKEIIKSQQAYKHLGQSIKRLERINVIRDNLDVPFCEVHPSRLMGVVKQDNSDIVELFSQIHSKVGDYTWAHLKTHGLVVSIKDIKEGRYPANVMYADVDKLCSVESVTLPGGHYLAMFSAGSMENNSRVDELITLAKSFGYQVGDSIYVEQVSGPIIEKEKQDFLVKILLPFREENSRN